LWLQAADHTIAVDSARGGSVSIVTSNTAPESITGVVDDFVFASDGFTTGDDTPFNVSGDDFVSWNWKEDPAYGFDIVSYTGDGLASRTVSHSLGVVPELMLVKNRDQVAGWRCWHKDMAASPSTGYLGLDTSNAFAVNANVWDDTDPTSSVFTVDTQTNVNGSGDELIAYLFASVEGFSKVFSYTGNAAADGPFVYCGFRPRYVMLKNTTTTGNWWMVDTERNTYNVINTLLVADLANSEASLGALESIDSVSNGFKVRATYTGINGSGHNIVGIAFAEHPFKYANAR
jgi:hypothetical protein